MSTETDSDLGGRVTRNAEWAKRLDEWAWAFFLIMTGIVWLVPEDRRPGGLWLIGTGAVLVLLNVARHFSGLKPSGFTSVLGVLALAGGVGELYGVELPLFALAIVILGVSILVRPLLRTRT